LNLLIILADLADKIPPERLELIDRSKELMVSQWDTSNAAFDRMAERFCDMKSIIACENEWERLKKEHNQQMHPSCHLRVAAGIPLH
jgi:hypothetical protein